MATARGLFNGLDASSASRVAPLTFASSFDTCDVEGVFAQLAVPGRTELEALRAEVARLRRCCVQAGVAAWRYQWDRGILFLSHECRSLFGFSSDESVDERTIAAMLCAGDRELLWQSSERARLQGSGFELEITITHRDGTPRVLLVRAEPDDEGDGHQGIVIDQTSQKREKDRLRLLSSLAQRTSNAVVVTGRDGCIEWVNEGFCRMSGWTLDEVVGLRPDVLSQGPDTDLVESARVGEAIANERSCRLELLNYAKDGRPYWIDIEIEPLRNEQGQVEHFMGVATDITARKEADAQRERYRQQLEQSVAALQGVVNGIEQSVVATDPLGTITLFNRGAERMLGWSADEMVGQASAVALHLDIELTAQAMVCGQSDGDFSTLVEPAKQGRVETSEWTYVRRDGAQLVASLTVSALRGSNGDLYGFLFVGRDVTAEHTAIEQKRTQAERLVKLSRRLPGMLYQYERSNDGGFSFPWVSERSIDVYGYTPDQLYEDAGLVTRRIHEDDRQRVVDTMRVSADRLSPWREQYRVSLDDGRVLWMQGDATPELQADGSVLWHGYVSEITKLKVFEAELVAAREQALDASRVKSQFLSNMSHEMRTPLNGIIGMSELLLEDDWEDEPKSLLEALRASGRSLLSLINDILDLSKVESGRFELETLSFSVRDLLLRARQTVALPAAEKGLELRMIVDDSVPATVKGDPTRILQVLVNLMGNAVKFTDRGEVCVSVGFAKDQLSVTVRDTGIGIAASAIARLFEPFTQADGSITRRFGGTGLGLAISRKLVERMHGSLDVTSEEGKGTCFLLRVPAPASSEQRVAPTTAGIVPSCTGPSLRVLVAEDNAINALLVRKILEREGHHVVHAVNGAEAVRSVCAESFDLVLMDIQMPVMDGIEATRKIRECEQGGQGRLHICALTANAMKGDIERCTEAGMDDYLTKPLDIAVLKQRLQALQSLLVASSQSHKH